MEIQTEFFTAIVEVQKIENEILIAEKDLNNTNNKINDIEENFKLKNNNLEEKISEIKDLNSQKKLLENEILEAEEKIKKHQIELNQVKKNEEFRALLKEIDDIKKHKDEFETKAIEIMELIDIKNKELSSMKQELIEIEKDKNKNIEILKNDREKLLKKIDVLKNKQDEIKKTISDATLLNRVENLLKNKNRMAIVKAKINIVKKGKAEVEEYFCSGCNMKLTFNDVSSIKKHNTFALCTGCSRLIYNED